MTTNKRSFVRHIYYVLGWVFTFINFLAFLVARDTKWIQNPGRTWMRASESRLFYVASDFERTLSCYGIGQCQRIGGALIVQPLIFAGDLLSRFYFWNVDDTARIFIIQSFGLAWRIVCFGVLGLCIYNFTKSVPVVLIFLNSMFFGLSGWFLRIVGGILENLPLGLSTVFLERSRRAFEDFPFEAFQWYDFGLFAMLPLTAFLIILISEKRPTFLQLFVFGIVLTSFFEYLGFVFALSWLIFARQYRSVDPPAIKYLRSRQFATVILGSAIWLGSIALLHRLMQSVRPDFFLINKETAVGHLRDVFWAVQHPIENLTANPSIPFQILLVLAQSSLLGALAGLLTRRIGINLTISKSVLRAVMTVTISMSVVIFVTFFLAYGIEIQAVEHSRQTIGLQIMLFTFCYLKVSARYQKISVI